MTKTILRYIAISLFSVSLFAQITPQNAQPFPGVPTGTCGPAQLGVNTSNGNLYSCNGGAWAIVSGGGGTPGGSNTQAQYNNSGSFGGTPALILSSVSPITPVQTANNLDVWYSKRFTDSAPTGNFIHLQNAAGAADLYKVDVLGNESASSITTGNGSGVAGAVILGQGSAISTPAANTFYITTPASVTRYGWILPSTGATGYIKYTTGDPGALSFVTPIAVGDGGTGITSGTNGGIPAFTATGTIASSGILNTNVLVKGGGAGATPTNSSVTDNGTTVSTSEDYVTTGRVQTGSSPPNCTAGTAGAWCATEGTAFTNVASTAGMYPDSTQHEYLAKTNGSSSAGMMVRAQPGSIHQTGQTANITTATLCAASAGACNVTGEYHIHWDFWGSGTACSNVTAGSVTFLLTWTDANAVTHSAVALQMMGQTGAATTAIGGTFPFQTALANEGASGDFNISTNGTIIQYATGYTACTTGTGTYNLDIVVTRIQ